MVQVTVRPWERFFDFPFRSYSCFRKKILLTAQKVFPLPTVGFYCTVKALALSARRPLIKNKDDFEELFASAYYCQQRIKSL